MSRALAVAAAVAIGGLAPAVAHACPVCFSGNENREAYFVTFVLLTTLPLLALGTVIWWLARRARALEERDRLARAGDPAHRS